MRKKISDLPLEFRDTLNPLSPANDRVEDTEHFCCTAILTMLTGEIFSTL